MSHSPRSNLSSSPQSPSPLRKQLNRQQQAPLSTQTGGIALKQGWLKLKGMTNWTRRYFILEKFSRANASVEDLLSPKPGQYTLKYFDNEMCNESGYKGKIDVMECMLELGLISDEKTIYLKFGHNYSKQFTIQADTKEELQSWTQELDKAVKITVGGHFKVVKKGYLNNHGGDQHRVKNWKRRYFILSTSEDDLKSVIQYFDKENGKPMGIIDVKDSNIEIVQDSEFTFHLRPAKGKSYFLQGDNDLDKTEWMKYIKKHARYPKAANAVGVIPIYFYDGNYKVIRITPGSNKKTVMEEIANRAPVRLKNVSVDNFNLFEYHGSKEIRVLDDKEIPEELIIKWEEENNGEDKKLVFKEPGIIFFPETAPSHVIHIHKKKTIATLT